MQSIGFWKTKAGYVSHKGGLSEEQVGYLKNLKVGDRLSIFIQDVREGEKGADLMMKRSTLTSDVPVKA